MKLRRMWYVKHKASLEEMRKYYGIWSRNVKERQPSERPRRRWKKLF
jgi:hypothetical protein